MLVTDDLNHCLDLTFSSLCGQSSNPNHLPRMILTRHHGARLKSDLARLMSRMVMIIYKIPWQVLNSNQTGSQKKQEYHTGDLHQVPRKYVGFSQVRGDFVSTDLAV